MVSATATVIRWLFISPSRRRRCDGCRLVPNEIVVRRLLVIYDRPLSCRCCNTPHHLKASFCSGDSSSSNNVWKHNRSCQAHSYISVFAAECGSKNPPEIFLTFLPKRLGISSPNFTRVLHVTIYARLQMFSQLTATLTKLRHIKRDHHYMLKIRHRLKRTLGGRT